MRVFAKVLAVHRPDGPLFGGEDADGALGDFFDGILSASRMMAWRLPSMARSVRRGRCSSSSASNQ